MNNDLEQFSEERLMQITQQPDSSTIFMYEVRQLARIALSAKQAKPVGYLEHSHYEYLQSGVNAEIWPKGDAGDIPVYTTPQPAHTGQAIPQWTNEQCLEFLSVAFRHNDIYGEISVEDIRLGVKFALAAAPKPDGTLINEDTKSDGWIKCSDRMPEHGQRVLTWSWQYKTTDLCILSRFTCLNPDLVTHWMPLPAAPKPESE